MKKLMAAVTLIAAMVLPIADAAAPTAQASVKFPCKMIGVGTFDPILNEDGSPSMHEHQFAGNLSLPSGNADFDTAVNAGSMCSFVGDSAGYWSPVMYTAEGARVPVKLTLYYDRMSGAAVTPFPPDMGLIWGYTRGLFDPKPRSYYGWNCDNEEPLNPDFSKVNCGGEGGAITLRTFSPYCWDGADPGIRNFSDHVVYPNNYPMNSVCPTGYVTLPRIRMNWNFQISSCPDCTLTSDMQYGVEHGASGHVDFWNTWNQTALEGLTDDLNKGASGGPVMPPPMTTTPPPMTTTTMPPITTTPAPTCTVET